METINWTQIGTEYNRDDKQKSRIRNAINALDWLEVPQDGSPLTLAAMPAMGLSGVIREFRIPHVSHVGVSADLAPFGFYGVRARYVNADVDLFFIDEGTSVVPVCQIVVEKSTPYASRAYAEHVFWRIINRHNGLAGHAPLECYTRLRAKAIKTDDGDVWDDMIRMNRCIATLGTGWKSQMEI